MGVEGVARIGFDVAGVDEADVVFEADGKGIDVLEGRVAKAERIYDPVGALSRGCVRLVEADPVQQAAAHRHLYLAPRAVDVLPLTSFMTVASVSPYISSTVEATRVSSSV